MSEDKVLGEGESTLQREAFEYYYSLGEQGKQRSYSQVALRFKKALTTIEKWGALYAWQRRVQERESQVADKHVEKLKVEKEVDYLQRNLRITKRVIYEHLDKLKNMPMTVNTLLKYMDYEHQLRTGVKGVVEVRHLHEIKNLSDEEIQRRLVEYGKKLLEHQNIKHFKDMPIVDAEYTEVKTKKGEEENE